MSQAFKHILVLLVVACILGGAYYLASASGVLESGIRNADEIRSMTDELEQDILADLARIDAINLDGSVFELPEYNALRDTTISITEQPISRPNPFDRY